MIVFPNPPPVGQFGSPPFTGALLETTVSTNPGGNGGHFGTLVPTNAGGLTSYNVTSLASAVAYTQQEIYTSAGAAQQGAAVFGDRNLFRGNVANAGGFAVYMICGTPAASFNADNAYAFQLADANPAAVGPSFHNINKIGFGADPLDGNWQVFTNFRTAGAITKVPTTLAKAANQLFYITISCGANAAGISMRVVQVTGFGAQNVLFDGLLTANLPDPAVPLFITMMAASATAAAAMFYTYARTVRTFLPAFN